MRTNCKIFYSNYTYIRMRVHILYILYLFIFLFIFYILYSNIYTCKLYVLI